MSKQEHPWVQDANSYEAVLCCLNNVHDWDQAATIRAYQTFGFDDASTPGNDQSYRHEDTGVMVLHDGDVVAIQFGDGNLVAALGDLFRVLSSLGWQKAEVYHPAHTMGALLTDMGNAIPAHMDFDVNAAKQDSGEVSQLPEAVALVERGRNLLQGVVEAKADANFNELALGELQSMEPGFAEPGGAEHVAVAVATSRPIALEDEGPASAISMPVRSSRPVFLDDDEAEPIVPMLGGAAIALPSEPMPMPAPSTTVLLDDEPEWEPAGLWADVRDDDSRTLPIEPGVDPSAPRRSEDGVAGQGRVNEPPMSSAPTNAAPSANLMTAPAATPRSESGAANLLSQAAANAAVQRRTIYVGKSALCFSEPGDVLDQDQVSQLSDQLGAVEVVNVWPGLVDQRDRWDVLGEIDLKAPWIAQLLVDGFGSFDATGSTCFAADLVHVARASKDDARPQLRDVTQLAVEGQGAAMSFLLETADIAAFRKSLMEMVAGLTLSGKGSAFVDVRETEEEGRAASDIRPFTIRSLVQASDSRLYVIHRDATDGRFVVAMIKALQAIASAYSSSVRAQQQAAALLAEQERQAERDRLAKEQAAEQQKAVAAILKTMSGLKSQLQTLGVALPEA